MPQISPEEMERIRDSVHNIAGIPPKKFKLTDVDNGYTHERTLILNPETGKYKIIIENKKPPKREYPRKYKEK